MVFARLVIIFLKHQTLDEWPHDKAGSQGQEVSREVCWLAGINIQLKVFYLNNMLWAPVLQPKQFHCRKHVGGNGGRR